MFPMFTQTHARVKAQAIFSSLLSTDVFWLTENKLATPCAAGLWNTISIFEAAVLLTDATNALVAGTQ